MWEWKFTYARYTVCLVYVDLLDLMGGRWPGEFVTEFCFPNNVIQRNHSKNEDVDKM
jgi:hypothetical protein